MGDRRTEGSLLVVSNRLPVRMRCNGDGEWEADPSSGGLVTAMEPVLRSRGGTWIGWPGVAEGTVREVERILDGYGERAGYHLRPVELSARAQQAFYEGAANRIFWPLFHGFPERCCFDQEYWRYYRRVNRIFAGVLVDGSQEGDLAWVHDYHLMTLAAEVEAFGASRHLAFFLHIPFPPPDILLKLPWAPELLESLLCYDLLGFQTRRDLRNFLDSLEALECGLFEDRREERTDLRARGEERSGVFPIAMEFDEFDSLASMPSTVERAARIRELHPDRAIVLGVDRLDYSKGIAHRLKAFREALRTHRELRKRATLTQLVVPSREGIPEYDAMKQEIERLVGEINGEFTEADWVPIHYLYGSWPREELVARYRAADVALVTPLRDGMNLVAKEYCASHPDGEGALVLSRFAGAAAQVGRDAILVNPYDVEETAAAIHYAVGMSPAERRERMRRMRATLRRQDLDWWVGKFLDAARSRPGRSRRDGRGTEVAPRASHRFPAAARGRDASTVRV